MVDKEIYKKKFLEYVSYRGHRHKVINGSLSLSSFIGENYKIKDINQIEGLEDLKELKEINLSNNLIKNIENLDNFISLRRLDLSGNRI